MSDEQQYVINNGYRVWTTTSMREVACEVMGVDDSGVSAPSEKEIQALMLHITSRLLRDRRYRYEMVPGKYIEVWKIGEDFLSPLHSHQLASRLRNMKDTFMIYVGFDAVGSKDRDAIGYVVDSFIVDVEGDELHPTETVYLQIKQAHL
jgi:hypothetical protein